MVRRHAPCAMREPPAAQPTDLCSTHGPGHNSAPRMAHSTASLLGHPCAGNVNKIMYGVDSMGNICGSENDWDGTGGPNLVNRTKLYYLMPYQVPHLAVPGHSCMEPALTSRGIGPRQSARQGWGSAQVAFGTHTPCRVMTASIQADAYA